MAKGILGCPEILHRLQALSYLKRRLHRELIQSPPLRQEFPRLVEESEVRETQVWKRFDLHCSFEGGEGHTRRNGATSRGREWPWLYPVQKWEPRHNHEELGLSVI